MRWSSKTLKKRLRITPGREKKIKKVIGVLKNFGDNVTKNMNQGVSKDKKKNRSNPLDAPDSLDKYLRY